jgi:hypothetical protein
MRVIYNQIDMMPAKTHEFSIESVYDDSMTNYLFSRGSIVIETLINSDITVFRGLLANGYVDYRLSPNTTTFTNPSSSRTNAVVPGPTTVPVAPGFGNVPPRNGLFVAPSVTGLGNINKTFGNSPSNTHSAIRHRLEMPRQKLYIYNGPGMVEAGIDPSQPIPSPATWGGIVCVEAPLPGFWFCDANNGPKPHIFSINEALGDANTLVVVWGCEFFINEATQNNLTPVGALLSNRFSQTHSVDEHGWTTIHTEGTAIFRTDLVFGAVPLTTVPPGIAPPPGSGTAVGTPFSPDTLRAGLFMPIPQGFTREIEYVTGLEDVTGVKYGYHDTQVPVNFVAGPFANPDAPGTGAASISVLHRQAITTNNEDILGSSLQAFERFAGIQANRNISKEKIKDKKADKGKSKKGKKAKGTGGSP